MNTAELTARINTLKATRELSPDLVAKLSRTLVEGSDRELFRMNTFAWAAQQGVAAGDALELFVVAAHVGLLDVSWGVSCPLCMGYLTAAGGLRTLRDGKYCAMCQAPAPAVLDERVEVTFTVSPVVRSIRFHDLDALERLEDFHAAYFATALAPEAPVRGLLGSSVISLGHLAAGGTISIPVSPQPGGYTLQFPSNHLAFHFVVVDDDLAPAVQELEVFDSQLAPSHGRVRLRGGQLRVRSRVSRRLACLHANALGPPPEDRPANFMVEHALHPHLSAQRLLTTQAFLDLFRADSVPAQGGLDVRSLTVLFTDLKGSTELYERVGDLRAFDLVMKHFDVLRETVRGHGGAVVKTIGDAVMASFSQPLDALAAAAQMQREVGRVSEEIVLKVGLHAGPCIAVELNERLDYFGQTVNAAARVQGLAEPGQIVCTAPIYSASGAGALAEAAGLRSTRDTVTLKGIRGEVPVLRLQPAR